MGQLLDRMLESACLIEAFERVESNQGCPGVDGQTIEEFQLDLEGSLERLRREVVTGRYQARPLLRVEVPKDSGGLRSLSIPAVRDRVLQSAATAVLDPILDPEFEVVSFAYRKGRSVDQALRRVIALRDIGYRWVVDADIDDYFDSIPHAPLLEALGREVTDPELLTLVEGWLRAQVQVGKERQTLTQGVPQGSPIAPLLANLYLDRLDEAFLKKGHKVVRFADDFVILCRSEPRAQAALQLTGEVLTELRLKLDPEKTRITDFESGFRFLGVQFLKSLAFRLIEEDDGETPDIASTGNRLGEAAASGPPTLPEPDPAPAPPSGSHRAKAESQSRGREAPEPTPTPHSQEHGAPETRFGKALQEAMEEAGIEGHDSGGAADTPPPPETRDGRASFDYDPLLRTLFLLEQGVEVSRHSRRLAVRRGPELLVEIPVLKLDQVVCFGNISWTTPAMQLCLQQHIPIFLLSMRGNYFGVIDTLESTVRTALLADQVTRVRETGPALAISRAFVRGKIVNSRVVLLRQARSSGNARVRQCAEWLGKQTERVAAVTSLEELRGVEGAAAARYFEAWRLILDPKWGFTGRRRHPSPDPVNSLLSYGYAILFSNVYSLLCSRGLHPYFGFYHTERPGHASLVSDLIEEFRAPVVDASVLALIGRRQVTPAGFLPALPGGPCRITPETRRMLTAAIEAALNRTVSHPDAAGGCDYRRAIALQAERVARAIRNPEEPYVAFTIR